MTSNADIAQEIKSSLNLVEEFRADGCEMIQQGGEFKCNCPFHGEDTPSCVVHDSFFKCFGCGEKGDIFNYLGLRMSPNRDPKIAKDFVEILREGASRANIEFVEKENPNNPKPPEQEKKVYTYEKLKQCCEFMSRDKNMTIKEYNESTNPDTKAVEFVEVRFEHNSKKRANGKPQKTFVQCAAVDGGFIFGLVKGKKTPLFNRSRIRDVALVVVVEGAKCMRFLQSLGVVACSAAGGSNNPVSNVDWSPLAGKTIILWPDFDSGGKDWAREVKKELEAICFDVSVVDVDAIQPPLNPKDDVVDYCERLGGTKEDQLCAVEKILDDSREETLERQIQANINGTRYAIRHPAFQALSSTLCFLPGSITMICASPGVSKSMMLLQWIWQMYCDGIECSLLALESGSVFHEARCLAQMCGNSQMLNPQWQQDHVDEVARIMDTFMPEVSQIRKQKVIQSPRDDQEVTPKYLVDWILQEHKRGRKLVAIDPITMMETAENAWVDQQRFVRDVKRVVRKTQIRLVLITHPKKNSAGGVHMDNAAGAVAFSQNTDTFVWMESHDTLFTEIYDPDAPMQKKQAKYNRTMRLLKHRLGMALKPQIGLYMSGETLRHEEIGFIDV